MNRRRFLKGVLGFAGGAIAGRVAGKSEDRLQPSATSRVDLATSNRTTEPMTTWMYRGTWMSTTTKMALDPMVFTDEGSA